MKKFKIPGVTISWKKLFGITKLKREFTKATGIPTTKAGLERKLGKMIIDVFTGKKTKKKKSGKDISENIE